MAVRLDGETGRSVARLVTTTKVLVFLVGVIFYFYGPALTPALRAAATTRCNELAGANYRSYRLDWVVGTRPHWMCGNAAKPAAKPVDMGWLVLPGIVTRAF